MACSTSYQTSKQQHTISIEDLLIDPTKSKLDKLKSDIPKMKLIIHDILQWISSLKDTSNILQIWMKQYHLVCRKHRLYPKKNTLAHIYRTMIQSGEATDNPILHSLLKTSKIRSMSGVTVITVLTSPYPNGQSFSCRHNCYYCPNEPGQPRSYLKKEPAVARANVNSFDPILQTVSRLKALLINSHDIDKVEFIIEGGTYTEYPKSYLETFHRDLIYAVNTYFDETKRTPYSIQKEIEINATAPIKIVGICIETRPDALIDSTGLSWLPIFRKWGVTRVQLGVQHTSNAILKKINRGHTIQQAINAIEYLKDNGFKVDIHIMPDLPGSTPEKDTKMMLQLFKVKYPFGKIGYQPIAPDQVKIYPCETTDFTIIKDWYQKGKYIPYAQTNRDKLHKVIQTAMTHCPPWIRMPRIVRDIPNTYIHAGNRHSNLRQVLEKQVTTMEIRSRECGRNPSYKVDDAVLVERAYMTKHKGLEYFLSYESPDQKCLFGFLRLRLPYNFSRHCVFPELYNCALIRELHVYGSVIPVGTSSNATQHRGIGSKLVQRAIQIAYNNGKRGIAVISGIGVVEYYKRFGFQHKDHFMVKPLFQIPKFELLVIVGIIFILLLAII